ncbi:type IV secretion protein Rhs [Rhizocola hellebori]|uniref:Type IV secretion protein Rhs n=1 Tax=Rhizocola hellebori TaxID=1392758 RepID=A0A8J3VD28_9ACTN|nr:phage baseplate assembly protein V [Rhizocola hellebori]GIH02127.1 type IV secretion protein Rhs [Rhizocola hellebori]
MIIPNVEVRLNARPLEARVLALRVAARISQPTQAEVTLAGPADGWPIGVPLRISIDDEMLFDGEVTAMELMRGPGSESAWVLRGYDLLHRLRKRQQPRVFENITVADLARALVADCGLEVECDNAGSPIPRLVQHRQTDWELLSQTAARHGVYLILDGDKLCLTKLRPRGEAIELKLGDTLWQARIEANVDRSLGSVTAIGWHAEQAEVRKEKATAPRRDNLPEIAVDATQTLVDQPLANLAEAAQAALDLSAARTVHLDGTARGNTALRPGRAVAVHGLADAVTGVHPLCSTIHTVTAEGYQTWFSTQPPSVAAAPSGASVTLGRVESVADPHGAGRVQVSLPAYGEVDLGWLSVLCPGAGPGKGIVALPDAGDLVVVALPHENPAEAIVLGSLYGPATPPDAGVEGGAVRRWTLHSGAGQSIVIDDEHKLVRLSNADGSRLELAPDLVTLCAHTDMVIEAPGHHLTIRSAAVDFEHAMLPEVIS